MPDLKSVFQKYENKKIVLYGLGVETEKTLLTLGNSCEILGILDGFQDSGEMYGKPILSISQMIHAGTEVIVVVARPGSCKAIAKRIGSICRERGITLVDIRGENLLESKRVTYDLSGIEGNTREELYQKIERADVVSFDLFDTLVMRQVMSYTDIIELTDETLREKGIIIPGFASRRLASEKRMAKTGAPTLEAIYADMLGGTEDVSISPAELAELEWKTDLKTIVPRKEVCKIYESCVCQGKNVYVVTDTYYRIHQIEEILERCAITGKNRILASCEHNRGKMQGLFEILKKAEGESKYLHLGDDAAADMDMAARQGMEVFHIFSGAELLDATGYMGMEAELNTLADRVKAGLLTSRLFCSPFRFETDDRRMKIYNAYDIGYLICAPMITDFMLWFYEKSTQKDIGNIWFSARDGYLLQKLYRLLDQDKKTVYFMTSRIAAIRAGMQNEDDIAYVDGMKFSGTPEENLKVRFGLEAEEKPLSNQTKTGLMRYKDRILSNAKIQRRRYEAYIEKLDIEDGAIAFFDFVAKGTTQMYVQKFVGRRFKGLYFLQLEPEYMKDKGLDIDPFYDEQETDKSAIFENYYILETILTAPHPYVCGFNSAGEAEFAVETRGEEDIRCFQAAQEGITDYFRQYLSIVPKKARVQNKKLDELILGLIQKIKIEDKDFLSLVVEDPFFNRTTDIDDLI